MKYLVKDFAKKFQSLAGDTTLDAPEEFIINGINWAFNELPMVPKLGRIFARHYTKNLDAKGHYRWDLNGDFRRLNDMPMINFWTSTGGELCKLNVCHKDEVEFYNKNGIPYLKKDGKPCEYTLEQEGDKVYLVFDRPLNVPVIVDYIAYGFPKPVTSYEDEIEISAIAENLILQVLHSVWYQEADDMAFSGAIDDYLDNKALPQAIQMLNKRYGCEEPVILGEM